MSKTLFGRLRDLGILFFLLLVTGTTFAALPRAHHIYISGTAPGANPSSAVGMKVLQTLRVYYTYADPDAGASQAENTAAAGTTFQWFTYDDELGTNPQPIAGATQNFFQLQSAQLGKYIAVRVTVKNLAGEVGVTREFRAFTATNRNKVLANGFSCTKAGGGSVSSAQVLDATAPLCSPRATTWKIDYTGIDWNNAFPARIFINWNDGGGYQTYTPTLVNNLLTPNDTINLTNMSNQQWTTTQVHTFNYATTGGTSTASTTANQVCTYTMQATWGYGTVSCAAAAPGNVQTGPFTVWDRENNASLGTFDINHDPASGGVETGEITDICVGDRTAVRVLDASDFNCTSVGGIRETVLENQDARWVQWVYGTAGSNVTTGPGATEKITINGVDYTSAQLPVYGRVTYQASPTSQPLPSITDNVQMPTSGTSGQVLMVTMRSWNFCNQLDRNGTGFNPTQTGPFAIQDITHVTSGGSSQPGLGPQFGKAANAQVFANATAVERQYTIRLKTKPLPPTYSPINFCEIAGVAPPVVPTNADFNITFGNPNGAGTYTLTVYQTNLATQLATDNTSPYEFNPVTRGPGGTRLDVTPPPNNPNVYHRYATLTGSNNCVSDPLDVEIRIQAVKVGGTITHALGATGVHICSGTDPVAFGQTDPTGGNNNGTPATLADDVFQWQSSPDGSTWTDIAVNGTNATYDPGSLTATTYYRRRVREAWYNITGSCDEAFSNVYQFIVDTPVASGSIGNPQTLCSGVTAPATITSVTPGSGGNGTPTYSWQFSTDNFATDINTIGATTATYTPPTPLTVTTYYRRANTSGVCSPAFQYSNVVTLTVQPTIVPGTISSAQTICNGQTPTALTGTASTGGSGAYTYAWESSTTSPGTTGFSPIGGATAQNFSPGALTTTTWYRRLTTSGVCAAQYSNTIEVTVNPLPTVAGVTGGGAVCAGNPAPDIVFTLTGTAPFNFTIDVNNASGDPDIVVTNHNSTTYTIVDPQPTTNTSYKIIALQDDNGCVATTLGGTANVTVGGFPPAFDTAPALGAIAVCSAGAATTDPSLTFSLDATSTVVGSNYTLNYRANGVNKTAKTFRVNAAGDIVQVNGSAATAITFNDNEFNTVAANTLRIVSIISPTGCQTILNQDLTFTVNPLPSGSSKTVSTACSPNTINIDIFNTSVATAAGGNNVASTYSWNLALNGLTGMATSGTTSTLSGTLTNPTNAVVNAVFTITPTSTATPACPGSAFTITVPVQPRPAIPDRTETICSKGAFSYTPANGNPTAAVIVPAGTLYTWTIPTPNANITGASAQAAGVAAIGQTLTNITNVPQTVRYVVTPQAPAAIGGCAGTPFNIDVTVNPTPVIADKVAAICSGSAFTITPANGVPTAAEIVPALTTYTWTNPVVTGGVTGGSAQPIGQSSISQTLTNTSTSPQTATYTVTATSGAAGACVSPTTFKITVTVNPIPKLNSTLTPSGICSGVFNYTATSLTGGATFTWSRPNIPGINEGANSGTNGNISETLTNPTTAPVDVTYTIITTANGCGNTGQDVVVRVNPTPIPNPVLGPANVCVGTNPFFYSVTQRAGSTYSWEIPATFTVEAAGGGVVAGGGPGPFTSDYFILLKFGTATPPGGLQIKVIEKSADGCIGLANTLTIVAANSPPTVPISGGTSFCKFEKGVVFSVPQNASSTFTWSVNSGATIIGPSAGTNLYQIIVDFNSSPSAQIDVTETNITGCPSNYPSLIVSLLDAPVITPTTGSICSGDQPSSVINLNTQTSVPSTFNWFVKNITGSITGAFVNDTGSGPLEHFPPLKNVSGSNATITYRVTPTSSAAPFCIGVPVDITVTIKPEPVVTPVSAQNACPLTFVPSIAFASNVAGATFTWTNDNTAIGLGAGPAAGNVSFTTLDNVTGSDITANINVTATAAGCTSTPSNSANFVFTLKPRPVITTTLNDIIVCPGDQVGPITFAGNAGGETFTWTNDNVAIGLTGGSTGNIAAYTAPVNTTGSDRIANITVKATKASCDGPSKSFRIIIHSKPLGAAVTRTAQCSNSPFSVSADNITNGMGATSTFSWVRNSLPAGLTEVTAGTGTGAIAETLRNLSGTTLSATYNVTARSADNCVSDAYVVTVPIYSEPVGAPITRAVQCSGQAFSVSADNISNGMGGSTSFTWVRNALPAGLTQVTAGTGSGAIAETLQNLTNGTLNATYVVTPRSNAPANCVGDTYVITVPVAPQPVGADITRAAQCSSAPFSVSADNITNGVTGSSFTWTRNALPVGLTQVTAGSGNGLIAETLKNTTSGTLNATYNVTPTLGTCIGAQYVITVPIDPEPVGVNITRASQCSDVGFSVSADNVTNGVAGSTFTWTRNTLPAGLGLVTAGTGTGAIAETLRNTSGASLSATYTVTPTSPAGCVGATYVVTVPIFSEPVGANMTATAQCSNITFSVDPNNIVNGLGLTSTYTWTRNALPAGLTEVTAGTGSGMISEKLENRTSSQLSAVYVVTPRSSDLCFGQTYTITIPVNPEPVGADITRAAQCSNVLFSVSAVNITNGLGATSSYTWTRGALPAGLVLVTPGTPTSSTISEVLRNTTGGQLTATYTVTPKSADNCSGAPYIVSVPIDSEPVGADITRVAQCSSAGFIISPDNITNGLGATSTYTWVRQTLPGGLSVLVPGDGNGNIEETLKNTTSSQLSAKYTVTPYSSAGCKGDTYVITVPINPEPVGVNITRTAQCSSQPFSVSADNITNGLGATSTYTWVRNPLSAGLTEITAGTGSGAIAETLQNLTSGQLSASYTVTAHSAAGCASSPYIVTVPINPEPTGTDITRVGQCSNVAFSVSPDNISNGLGASSTYTWVRDPLPGGLTQVIGGSGSGMIAETLRNTTSGTLNAEYVVTPTSAANCAGVPYKVTIPINPEPVGANATRVAQCSSVPFSVSADNVTNGVVGATFSWTRLTLPLGLTVISGGTSGATIDETLKNTTSGQLSAVYRVTPSVGGCAGATYDITVPVNPEPVGVNITRAAQCSNVAFSLSADNITNGVTGSTFTWTRQTLPPGLTEIVAGTGSGVIAETIENKTSVQLSAVYVVTPTSGAGCAGGSYIVTVPINPQPVGADITRAAQCSNVGFSLSADNITNGLGGSSNFTWVRRALPAGLTVVTAGTGSGLIAEKLRNLTGGVLNAEYEVTPRTNAPNNCAGDMYVVTVPITPEPVGADITRAAECSSKPFSVSADNIGNVAGSTFTWVRQTLPVGLTQVTAGTGSGPIAETLKNATSGPLDAKYTVTPTAGGCVGDTYVVTVPINPEPVGADITRAVQCSNVGFSVSPDNVTNGVGGNTFTWVRDNLPVGLSLVTAGTGSGMIAETIRNITGSQLSVTYKVTPTSGAGCAGTFYTVTVPINPEPVGGNITRTAQCSNVGFSIDPNNITNGLAASTTFTWSREPLPVGLTVVTAGTGSGMIAETLQNLTSGQLNAVYRITPTTTALCAGDVYFVTVPVNPEPVGADITRAAQCSNVAFTVSAINITNNLGGTSTYVWTRQPLPAGLTVLVSGTGSGGTINETLKNTTGGTLNAVYRVTPTSADICAGQPYFVTIPIDSEPVGTDITRAAQCSGVAFNVSADNITNGMSATTSFSWTRNALPGGLSVVASGNGTGSINETLRNTTGGQLSVSYTVTPRTAANCAGTSYVVTIPINPEPLGSDFTTAAQCSNVAFSLTADHISNGLGATSTYTWVRNPLPGGLVEITPGDGTGNIEETLRNLSGTQLVASYVVTPTSGPGCQGGVYTIYIPINSEPVGADITRAQACSNVAFSVSADNITNGMSAVTSFTWVRQALPLGLTEVLAGTGSGPIAETLKNVSSGQLSATYVVTPKSSAGCNGDTYIITVPVNPEPVGADITRAAQCSDSPFVISADNITNGVIGVTFTWTRQTLPVGLVAVTNGDGTGDIEETLKNTTSAVLNAVYEVTPKAGTCAGVPYLVTVPINGEPVVANGLDRQRCSDAEYGVVLSTTATSEVAASYDIEVVSIDAGLTGTRTVGMVGTNLAANFIEHDKYTNHGTIALKVVYRITPNGVTCIGDPKLVELTVYPEPVLGTPPNAPVCSGSNINVLLGTDGISVAANLYRIDNIEYSNGGPFSTTKPAFFTGAGTNKIVTDAGNAALVQNDLFTNKGAATVTVRYTITPISGANPGNPTGCEGDPTFITVDVRPEPDLDNSLSPAAICSGETIISNNPGFMLKSEATSIAASTFIIRSITNLAGLTPGGSNAGTGTGKLATAINNDTWVNTTAGALQIIYTIAPVSAAGCIGQDEDITLTVNPSPAVKDGLDRFMCDSGTVLSSVTGLVLQNATSSISATSFDVLDITVGGVTILPGTTVGGLSSNASNGGLGVTTNFSKYAADKFVNNTTDRIVVSYTVVGISAANCRGPQKVITVTVEPAAVSASTIVDASICSGEAIDITFVSPTYANGDPTNPLVTFSYAATALGPGITGQSVGNFLNEGDHITDILVNTSNAPVQVRYRITPKAAAAASGIGCSGLFQDIIVTVEPRPKINPIADKNVCEGVPVGITLTSTSTPSAGTIKIMVTALAAGTDPEVTGYSNGVLFANNSTINDVLSNSASVTKYVTYRLEVLNVDATNATICSAGSFVDVKVGVTPTPVITPIADFAICSGAAFNPIPINTDTETATPGSTTITWKILNQATNNISGDANGGGAEFTQALFNATDDAHVATYEITAKNISNIPSCSAPVMTLKVKVYPNPKVKDLPARIDVCNNAQLPVLNQTLKSNVVAGLGTTYDWFFDDGTNPVDHQLNQTAITQVFTNPSPALSAQTFTITAHLTIPAGDNPKNEPANNVSPTCTNQADAFLTVNVAPQVGGDIYGLDIDGNPTTDVYLCRGSATRITLDPEGLPQFTVDYKIGADAFQYTGSGGKVLSNSPTTTTEYELIQVKDKFGCIAPINKKVTVHVDAVDVALTAPTPDTNCSPFDAVFKYNQVAGVEYTWHWGDGIDDAPVIAATSQTNQTITHRFENASTNQNQKYTVTFDASLDPTKFLNGCRKTSAGKTVTVYNIVAASIFPHTTEVCSGDPVQFDNSTLGAVNHKWYYRIEGSAQQLDTKNTANATFNIENNTTDTQNYEVVYEADNGHGCPAEQVVTLVKVYRGIDAHFIHTTPTLFVGGHSTMSFTNDSSPVDGADFRYEWNFGLNGTSSPANTNLPGPNYDLDYTSPGPKTVVLIVTNLDAEANSKTCQDTYTETFTIAIPPLIADFVVVPLEACFPTEISVTDNLATGDRNEWRLLDNAGLAGTSNVDKPSFRIPSPGKYTVELTTTNTFTGDQKTATKDVIVYDVPMASFDFRPGVVYVPDTELLTYNFSSGATGYAWDFGDGTTSDEKEPVHTYKIENVYDIMLIALNDHGNDVVCYDTLVRKVTAKQGGITRVPNAFTPNPNGPVDGPPGANTFNDVFLPQVKGAEEFNMQVFDRWGNLIFESNNSNIGWNGYDKNGKLLPAGVYVYKLTLRLSDGQRTTQVGDITMIR